MEPEVELKNTENTGNVENVENTWNMENMEREIRKETINPFYPAAVALHQPSQGEILPIQYPPIFPISEQPAPQQFPPSQALQNLLSLPLIFSPIPLQYIKQNPISKHFINPSIQPINIHKMWQINGIDVFFNSYLQTKFPHVQPNCINFLCFPSNEELLKREGEGARVFFGDTSKSIHFFQDPIKCVKLCDPLKMTILRVLVYIPPNAPGYPPNFQQEEDGSVTIFRDDLMYPTHMFQVKYGKLSEKSGEYWKLCKEYKSAGRKIGQKIEPLEICKLQSCRRFYRDLKDKYEHNYKPECVKTGYLNASKSGVDNYSNTLKMKDLMKNPAGGTYRLSRSPDMDRGKGGSKVNVRCLYYDYGHKKTDPEETKEQALSYIYISQARQQLFLPTHWIKGRNTGGSVLPNTHPIYSQLKKEFEDAQTKHLDKLSIKGVVKIPGGENGKDNIKKTFGENYNETYYRVYYSATTAHKIAKYYETGRRSSLMTWSAKGTLGNGFYYSKDPIDCSRFYSKDKLILRVEIYMHPHHKSQKDEEGRICLEALQGIIVTHSIRYKGQKNIHTYKLPQGIKEYNTVNSHFEAAQTHGTSLKVLSIRRIKKKEGEDAQEKYKKTCAGKMLSLFHGTKVAMIDAITFQTEQTGFKMPAHAGMLGVGIYFAPDPAKSLQYCDADKLLFQCDVWIDQSDGPKKAKYAQNAIYDEWCVYDTNAGNPKYIIKFA